MSDLSVRSRNTSFEGLNAASSEARPSNTPRASSPGPGNGMGVLSGLPVRRRSASGASNDLPARPPSANGTSNVQPFHNAPPSQLPRTNAVVPQAAAPAFLSEKIASANNFDDLCKFFDEDGIATMDPSFHQPMFLNAAIKLVNKFKADFGTTTPRAERAAILQRSVTGLAGVPDEGLRSAAMKVASSKLLYVPREEQQSVFDHILATIKTLPPTSRSQTLESLAVHIFKFDASNAVDRDEESIDLGRKNMKAVLASLVGLDGAQKKPALKTLAEHVGSFAMRGGDWRSPFDDLVSAMHQLPPELQPDVRQALKQQLAILGRFNIDVQDALHVLSTESVS